jgi:hypothetical protein
MFTDPITLLDQTIDNLETVAVMLGDEVDTRIQTTAEHNGVVYRAAQSRIGALLPTLRAARALQESITRSQYRAPCLNCD